MPADLTQAILTETPLTAGTTDSNGRISVSIPNNYDFRPFMHGDSTVSISITASKGTDSTVYNLRGAVPRSATTASGFARMRALSTATSEQDAVPLTFGKVYTSTSDPDDSVPVAPSKRMKAVAAAAAASTPGVQDHQCISGWRTSWELRSDYEDRNVSVVRFLTQSNSTMTYDWNTKNETQSGVSYEYSGGSGTVSAKAGFEENVSSEAGTTLRAANNKTQWGALQTRFRKYEKHCTSLVTTQYVDAGSWQWRPYEWKGATAYKTSSAPFSCNSKYKVSTPDSMWVSKSASNSVSGAFSINGLSLDAKQTNSSQTKYTVNPDSGKTMSICGSEALPPAAKQVREV